VDLLQWMQKIPSLEDFVVKSSVCRPEGVELTKECGRLRENSGMADC